MPHQRFLPFCGMFLQIGETFFEFLPHPSFLGEKDGVFYLEGGTAFIYKIIDVDTGVPSALKVFKRGFRAKQIAAAATALARYENLPALQAEQRLCITRARHAKLINTYPELEFAILMPWVDAPSWAGLLFHPQLSSAYTYEQARVLAQATANVLGALEAQGIAHADLAGSNLVPSPDRQQIQLLDLENMYLPGLPPPPQKSQGTPGYQHQFLGSNGQWCPAGDRFAGAILLTEMLTWWNARARARVSEDAESLFRAEELQTQEAPCLPVVRDTLYTLSPRLLELFDQAWLSRSLEECPPLSAWTAAIPPGLNA
ncbi:MAG TPA: hypothetical protein VF458_14945 [Ktedonobacteraceae bacterium]